ncbi:MAG TPA: sensor histidine kinase [Nitrososphaeraceae archaeon]|nr:sensor histidine kinase [Nitrososphaeraceae archaeon]
MITLVTTSIVVPSVIALNTFTRSLETEITEELKINALNAMDKLSRLMFERVALIRFLTDPGNLVISGSDNNFTIGEKVEFLRQMEKAYKAYASISLYNKHGIKIGDTRSIAISVNDSQEAFYKNAINGSIYYDQVPIFSSSLLQHVIHFSGPLYAGKNNQINGVLVLTFPLNKINDIMLEAGGSISKEADIDLLSNDGLIIYSNNDQKSVLQKKVTGMAIFDKLRNSTKSIEVKITADDQSSSGTGQTIFIGAKEPGFLDYKGNNWLLIIAINTEDAFKSVALLRNQFIIIAVVILSISIASVFIFARTISKPIAKLRDVTNEVSKGNFDITVDFQKGGDDELAQLSTSFENMRQTILVRTKEVLKANEKLKLNDRMQKEFINIASHELRTPIQPILGLTQIIRSKIKDTEQRELLDNVIRNAKRLQRLAEDILDITRIESQSLKLNKEEFNLKDLTSNVVQEYRNQIEKDNDDDKNKNNITLLYESKKDINFFVEADRYRLTQVISNLLNNAIKFTKEGEGRTLSVTLEKKKEENNQQEVLVSVKDSGTGIHSDILPRLFSKFATKSEKGTGLGLFISKSIVEAHGGRIWAENNPDGRGATFYFSLPLSK